ncbi:hypothetical protein [Nocardioides houyundeii]|uniref:hypothetical protein n=1 Tax=Nocardioides houyundeii TaxID=2045452 RepID=UPI00131578B7|nr:hypothetical protein [Nocardioides houyundeii]
MRYVAGAVGLLLVGGLALGCGESEDDTPEPTTKERHCSAYQSFFSERASHGSDASDAEVVATLKGWGEDLEEIGAPEDMTEDAKAGHDIWVDLIGQVRDDANQSEVVALEAGLSGKQVAEVEEFFAYNDSECLSASSGPTDQPSDPTD